VVGTAGIRTYDFYRVKVQRKGPNEQSKGAEQLHPGYRDRNVRKMELIRDGDFLNDNL